jgi:hypothetical protein
MADAYCKYEDGPPVTCHAAGALTGGRMCRITAAPTGGNPTVNVPAAAGRTFGVVARDTASGAKCTVFTGNNFVWIEAGATLAAGDLIEATVTGVAIVLAAGICQGEVVEGGASGALCLIDYRPRKV